MRSLAYVFIATLAASTFIGCRELQSPEEPGLDGFVFEATVVDAEGVPIPDCYVEFQPTPRSEGGIEIATQTSDTGRLKVFVPNLRRWNIWLRASPMPSYTLADVEVTASSPRELRYGLVRRTGQLALQLPSTISDTPDGFYLNLTFSRALSDSRRLDYSSSTNVEDDGTFSYWFADGYYLRRVSFNSQIGARNVSYLDERDQDFDPNDLRIDIQLVECTVSFDASDTPDMPDALSLWSDVEGEARSSCRNTVFPSSQDISVLLAPGAGRLQLEASYLAGSLFPWIEYVEFEQGARIVLHPLGAKIQVRTVDSSGNPIAGVSVYPTLVATSGYSPSLNTDAFGFGELYVRRGLHVVRAGMSTGGPLYFEGLFDFQSDETITIVLD